MKYDIGQTVFRIPCPIACISCPNLTSVPEGTGGVIHKRSLASKSATATYLVEWATGAGVTYVLHHALSPSPDTFPEKVWFD